MGGAATDCPACTMDSDCPIGSRCGQLGGDSFCAPDCTNGEACSAGRTCLAVNTIEGAQASLCVTDIGMCAIGGNASAQASTGSGETCGSLVGPDLTACCASCSPSSGTCQPNGCYGGWWCNADTCKCQAPPNPSSCGGASTSTGSGMGGAGGSGGTVGPNGGSLDTLSFAIVGDTRPPSEDDLGGYPTAIISKIWQDVEAINPRPAFAVTTGDYQFSNPFGTGAAAQLDKYVQARGAFSNIVFPAMGNHECTGATASNCGAGNADGITKNYSTYLSKLLAPIGETKPYYEIDVSGTAGDWNAKFVFIAANAWDAAQASWLKSALSKPTTYTFVIRHEGTLVANAPGVSPSASIIALHPYTILIAGHTHTYGHYASDREIIVGNGGAPLTGSIDYGYVVARQRHSDNAMQFWAYDYSTGAVVDHFDVQPDGAAAP
jgi:hypothetical protein